MGQVLHGCATTAEAVRRATQNSYESLSALPRYGTNQEMVAKWKKRSSPLQFLLNFIALIPYAIYKCRTKTLYPLLVNHYSEASSLLRIAFLAVRRMAGQFRLPLGSITSA